MKGILLLFVFVSQGLLLIDGADLVPSILCLLLKSLCPKSKPQSSVKPTLNQTLELTFKPILPTIQKKKPVEITVTVWNSRNRSIEEIQLQYGNETQVTEIFKMKYELFVFFHGVGHTAKDEWILKSKEKLLQADKGGNNFRVVISVGYEEFIANTTEAIANLETIAHTTAVFLNWTINAIHQLSFRKYVGHGMGCYIAQRMEEKLTEFSEGIQKLLMFVALDPDIFSDEDLKALPSGNPKPQITKSIASMVFVYHTSTCYHIPTIKECDDSTKDTMGHYDFYPNGGAVQPGCHDYACSKDRATELFVYEFEQQKFETILYASACPNFTNFVEGKCPCGPRQCYEMVVFSRPPVSLTGPRLARYFLWTNPQNPFGRGNVHIQP